jgi:hypothetical protein
MGENLKAQDTARFQADATADEMRASFVCRYCIRTARVVVVLDGLHGINAFCHCEFCGPQTVVGLTRSQLEQLRRCPPTGIDFDFVP